MKTLGIKVKTAVIPAAGVGTRLLPLTKSIPKELLPVGNKPLLGHIIDECVEACIERIILIISHKKHAIIDYLNRDLELERFLQKKSATSLAAICDLPKNIKVEFVYQNDALGLGHAILQTEKLIADKEHFAILLPDVLMPSKHILQRQNYSYCLKAMLDQLAIKASFNQNLGMLALQSVDPNKIKCYGIATLNGSKISSLIEKPKIGSISSNLSIVGRYILPSSIFKHIKGIADNHNKNTEIQITDAISSLISENADIIPYICDNVFLNLDSGNLEGLYNANKIYAKSLGYD